MSEEIEDILHSMDPVDVYAIGVKSGRLETMSKVTSVLIKFKNENNNYSLDTLILLDKLINQLNTIEIDE